VFARGIQAVDVETAPARLENADGGMAAALLPPQPLAQVSWSGDASRLAPENATVITAAVCPPPAPSALDAEGGTVTQPESLGRARMEAALPVDTAAAAATPSQLSITSRPSIHTMHLRAMIRGGGSLITYKRGTGSFTTSPALMTQYCVKCACVRLRAVD